MQHIGLFKFGSIEGSACDEGPCIYTPLLLSNNAGASLLACLLVFRIGDVASAGFVVVISHQKFSNSGCEQLEKQAYYCLVRSDNHSFQYETTLIRLRYSDHPPS